MRKLIIENVRCFKGKHEIPLARLTFAVGENSSGKSTLLALVKFATQVAAGEEPDFNAPPFSWGSYDHIAHYHGGQGKRSKHFRIGMTTQGSSTDGGAGKISVIARFEDAAGQPQITHWLADFDGLSLNVSRPAGSDRTDVELKVKGRRVTATAPAGDRSRSIPESALLALQEVLFSKTQRPPEDLHAFFRASRALGELRQSHPGIHAVAPIRSRPERTYDPVRDSPQGGEGNDVPQLLAKLWRNDPARWATLKKPLLEFGKASGLFTDIGVVGKGAKKSDPFQVHVQPGRFPFNVVDVGYGVSQALPVLVQALRAERGSTLLLQQPEVHLHPRAQAAMGTFLTRVAVADGRMAIVETHSDYMVDRALMEIRDRSEGDITASDLALLFFERESDHSTFRRIQVSEAGEIIDPPTAYRAFFLHEQARFLGVAN